MLPRAFPVAFVVDARTQWKARATTRLVTSSVVSKRRQEHTRRKLIERHQKSLQKIAEVVNCTEAATLRGLIGCSDPFVIEAIIGHPLADLDIVRRVLRRHPLMRRAPPVRRALAARSDRSAMERWRLSRNKRFDVRRAIAVNPATSERRLTALADDGERWVREAVAGNRHTPPETLARLTMDSRVVQLRAADNPMCPTAALDRLLGASDEWVQGVALGNENCSGPLQPPPLLERCLLPWALVRAANNATLFPDGADEILTWVTLGGAGPGDTHFDPFTCSTNPLDASKPLNDFLASRRANYEGSPLWPVELRMLQLMKNAPPVVLQSALHHPAVLVRLRAAAFTYRPVLDHLRWDVDPRVRATAALTRVAAPAQRGNRRTARTSWVTAAIVASVLLAVARFAKDAPAPTERPSVSLIAQTAEALAIHRADATFDGVMTLHQQPVDLFTRTVRITPLADSITVADLTTEEGNDESFEPTPNVPRAIDSSTTFTVYGFGDLFVTVEDQSGGTRKYRLVNG